MKNMKKILIYLIIFSINFAAQYEITKKLAVKMSKNLMEQEAENVEKGTLELMTEEGMRKCITRIKKEVIMKNNKYESLEEEIQTKFISEVMALLFSKAQIQVSKIEFIDNKQAEVTFNYKIPTISMNDIPKFEKNLRNEFKLRMGYPISSVNKKVLSAADKLKIDKLIKEAAKKSVKSDLKNPIYNTGKEKQMMEKSNDGWRCKITVWK